MTWIFLASAFLVLFRGEAFAFNAPPGVDTWCGKAYQATNASFNPGGQFEEPPHSDQPLFDLGVRPRMSLYLDTESEGSFLVDALISHIRGQPFTDAPPSYGGAKNGNRSVKITVVLEKTQTKLISDSKIPFPSEAKEISFSLGDLSPQNEPLTITVTAVASWGQTFSSTGSFYFLPTRTDGGSVSRIDNLYGSLQAQDYLDSSKPWVDIFPYGFYVDTGIFDRDPSQAVVYKDAGYNLIHLVPNLGAPNRAFPFEELEPLFKKLDEIQLWLMFDMRGVYTNASELEYEINLMKSHPSILLWYTADEPDGTSDVLNGTSIAYNSIKSLDPYHPVSLVLNCRNFYYKEYTSGTDIILSDAYPIGINATFSVRFSTPCNATYGDCGCDDCSGSGVADVATGLDVLRSYDQALGQTQPHWMVPQAFGGSEYWSRVPNAREEVAMQVLGLNHKSMGLVMWIFPTSDEVKNITSTFSKVLAGADVTKFTLHSELLKLSASKEIDSSGWIIGQQMLIAAVTVADGANVEIQLPQSAKSIDTVLWGSGEWTVEGRTLHRAASSALDVDIFVLGL